MSVMQSEVFEAFRAIDIPEDKALKAATALSKRDDDVASIKAELLLVKWMVGFVLAFQIAVAVKLFMH
ncbi:MAG: integrase [Acetobacteraceae bacterium]|nr:integrase [Acetobacteraceae bacterium]